jgi:hypothetical protein
MQLKTLLATKDELEKKRKNVFEENRKRELDVLVLCNKQEKVL